MPDRKRLFCVVSADGETYYVPAESFGAAVELFKEWERGDSDEEYEDPQSVSDVGYLIVPHVRRQDPWLPCGADLGGGKTCSFQMNHDGQHGWVNPVVEMDTSH